MSHGRCHEECGPGFASAADARYTANDCGAPACASHLLLAVAAPLSYVRRASTVTAADTRSGRKALVAEVPSGVHSVICSTDKRRRLSSESACGISSTSTKFTYVRWEEKAFIACLYTPLESPSTPAAELEKTFRKASVLSGSRNAPYSITSGVLGSTATNAVDEGRAADPSPPLPPPGRCDSSRRGRFAVLTETRTCGTLDGLARLENEEKNHSFSVQTSPCRRPSTNA
ncbi:hypothetical protein MRX96_011626 [Rhipicephalus microplus]